MTRPYLLDTNIVLLLVRGGALGRRIDATYGLTTARQRPLLSLVSVVELRVLAAMRGWGTPKSSALERAIDNLVVVDINFPEILDAYTDIDVASRKHSAGAIHMGKNDLWIAACAKATGSVLLTTDKDFDHLSDGQINLEYVDQEAE